MSRRRSPSFDSISREQVKVLKHTERINIVDRADAIIVAFIDAGWVSPREAQFDKDFAVHDTNSKLQ